MPWKWLVKIIFGIASSTTEQEIKITCITVGNDKKAIIVYRQFDCVSRKFKEKNKKFYFVIYPYVAK